MLTARSSERMGVHLSSLDMSSSSSKIHASASHSRLISSRAISHSSSACLRVSAFAAACVQTLRQNV